MSDDVGFSISQFRDAWEVLCGPCPGSVVDRSKDIEYIFGNLPIPFFNAAVVTARDLSRDALMARGREACAWAADKAVPWMCVVTHEALAPGVDAVSALDACGLTPMLPLTGMRAHRLTPATRRADGVTLEIPQTDAGCADVVDVNTAAYGVDLEASKPVLGQRAFWTGHVPAVARAGDSAVACAGVFIVDGYRYVALVATRPDHQRRGYAEGVMRHALDVAAATHGDKPTVLHATDAGRPVYARMGYETIATHTAFIEKRFLEGH